MLQLYKIDSFMWSLFYTIGDSPEATSSIVLYLLCDVVENKNNKEVFLNAKMLSKKMLNTLFALRSPRFWDVSLIG